jgi:flagellar hook-associated protein 3 FlgL
MRITNNMVQRESLARIQTNLRGINSAQAQVSSGLRISRPSDDPTAAASVMRANGSLHALVQYRRNIDSATARASAEDGVLSNLTELLTRARELGVSQGTATASDETRAAAKAEVDALLDQAIALGNTQFGDAYLFGGLRVDAPPFQRTAAGSFAAQVDPDSGLPVEPAGSPKAEIGAGLVVPVNHDGTEAFVATGALGALRELSDALKPGGTQAAVQTAAASLTRASSSVAVVLGETGARVNQLEVARANLDALEINLSTFKSDLEEVDLEKAMTELVSRQTAYQAAMMATSKVIGMNLTDYLR